MSRRRNTGHHCHPCTHHDVTLGYWVRSPLNRLVINMHSRVLGEDPIHCSYLWVSSVSLFSIASLYVSLLLLASLLLLHCCSMLFCTWKACLRPRRKFNQKWSKTATGIHCLFTTYSLPIHCLFTAYSLSIHCLFTVYSLPIHCLFTAYLLLIHYLFTAYSLPIHCLFTADSLPIHCLFTAYSLPNHCLFTAYPSSFIDLPGLQCITSIHPMNRGYIECDSRMNKPRSRHVIMCESLGRGSERIGSE
jgi:hypothetical protein